MKIAVLLAGMVILAGVAWAEDSGPVPGGIEIGAATDGTPVFMLDIAAIDKKAVGRKRWYAKPGEVLRQVGSNTAENVTTHPGKWFSAGVLGYLVASGEGEKMLEKVFGGSDDDKDGAKIPKVPATATQPGLGVYGQGNSVSVPSTVVSGPIVVGGDGNTVNVYEPEPVESQP